MALAKKDGAERGLGQVVRRVSSDRHLEEAIPLLLAGFQRDLESL